MTTTRGIDVAAKYGDIRRITLRHYSVRGVSPDDLVQEVVLTILVQNKQPCAWDPARSAMSSYIHMVAGNVASKLAGREGKQGKVEAALRDELRPASGQRSKVSSDTTPAPEPSYEAETTWAAALDGTSIQLSLFGWDPLEIPTVARLRRPRKARAPVPNPAQLNLFARAA